MSGTCNHGALFGLLLQRINVTDDCWLWTGFINDQGYGLLQWDNRRQRAHRLVHEVMVGPIPEGLELDHLCRVRHCVRPQHLDPVTHLENMQRGEYAQRTTCVHGHPFDEANTYYTPDGWRRCRRCRTLGMRKYARAIK